VTAELVAPARTGAVAELARVVGAAHVDTDDAARRFAAADFADRVLAVPLAVVRPGSTEEVAAVVRTCRAHGLSLTVRGGGMSYTSAHLPASPESVVVDVARLDRVVEVNAADRYVVVEPGVTWAQLSGALAGTGAWVPHLGTLSGRHATVGGGLSQQATGIGQGFLTDYVLGLDVVLGDGRVVRTGSGAAHGTPPVLREFGPDLSGLFLYDSGALGIKTRAVLRLDPVPGGTAYGCFAFDRTEDLVAAQVAIARTGLASTCVGSDAYANSAFASVPTPSRQEVLALARGVLTSGTSRWRAVRTLLGAARPGGLGALARVPNLLAYAVDAPDSASADRGARRLARIARAGGGRPVSTAIAVGMRHAPFQPIHPLMVGPRDDSTVPSNALFPLLRAGEALRVLREFWAENAGVIAEHDLRIAHNFLVMRHVHGVEPLIYWPDRPSDYRLAHTRAEDRERLATLEPHPDARAAALDLRARMIGRLREAGSTHIQLGKFYPYREALAGTPTWDLLVQLKGLVDPGGVLNPGALGLPPGPSGADRSPPR
jgi:D-lactate dehydrogenase (cytochrome)